MKVHHHHTNTVVLPMDSSFYLLDDEFDRDFDGGTDVNTRLLPIDDEGRVRDMAEDELDIAV